jgi:mannitol-1-phosphate 5-dehydrogenase
MARNWKRLSHIMNPINVRYQLYNRKIIIFGAGRIGRSFIGQLFSRSGYDIVFIDINPQLIDALNRIRKYKVVVKSDLKEEVLSIETVRAVSLADRDKVIYEIATGGIAALSVGQQGMPATLPLIAEALQKRKDEMGMVPLDFIICENMRNADQYISTELRKLLPENYPFDQLVGLVETSIGKMVPIMTQRDMEEDPLQIFAEPYNTLIVSKDGFRNPIPAVMNMEPKENMKAWVDRKLFIHNLGHSTAAYLGFQKHPEAVKMHEVLSDPEILESTRKTMFQSAEILMRLYPDEFTVNHLTLHIDDLLSRFRNKALGDTVFRVGCDLYRKLGPEDRLAAPISVALKLNRPYDMIMKALKAAVVFRAKDENGQYFPADEEFFRKADSGIEYVLREICKLEIP